MFTMAIRTTLLPPFGPQFPVFVEFVDHNLGMPDIRAVPQTRLTVHLRLWNFLLFQQLQQSGVTYAKHGRNLLR
jgi:hypothetical protein